MDSVATQPLLALPQVTLLAVTSVNVPATVAALEASMAGIAFGAAKLLTDRDPGPLSERLEHVPITPLHSSSAYSEYVLQNLADHIATSHALLVQWDGHVLDAGRWLPEFLAYDYIGASWPQFDDGWDVGNGGFSLRSRRLIEACRDPAFRRSHPEDLAICRDNRALLEAWGMRFAPRDVADAFSAERAGNSSVSFGYHGVWHMPQLMSPQDFWRIYQGLDERTSVRHNFGTLVRQLASGQGGASRSLVLLADRLCDAVRSSLSN